jgi:putative transposase
MAPKRRGARAHTPTGFEVIRRRWVVERTFAWMRRNWRMSRDYEFLPETGEALILM